MTRLSPLLILLLSGCAAVRAGVQLQDAMSAKEAALERDADENAPYEWTMASLYLDKAWEEMGTGQYRMCVTLAKKSAEWSDLAVVTVERGKRTLHLDVEAVPDAGVVPDPTREVPPPPEPKEDASLESADDIDFGGKPRPTPAPTEAPAPDPAPAPAPPAPVPAPAPTAAPQPGAMPQPGPSTPAPGPVQP